MKDNKLVILGLSFFYHDSAAALLVGGKLVAAASEERFSRKKNDFEYPKAAIRFVLEKSNISALDIDYVVFYEKPFRKFERIIKTLLATWPEAPLSFAHAVKAWFIDKFWVRNLIAEDLSISSDKILFANHHLSHAASSFFCSPYEKAAILTVDGVGEWGSTTIGIGEKNKIRILKEIHFPHSIGLLYSAFTAFLGFEVNEGEYKVMGMAPYGTPRYTDQVKKMIRQYQDGSFELDLSYFRFHKSTAHSYSKKFVSLFGKPRTPGAKFFTLQSGWLSYFGECPKNWKEMAKENEHYADIAASLQKVTEELLINLARAAQKETGCKQIAYAGGVALNSVANTKILEQAGFENMYIQPAAGDAGGALGAALYVHYALLDNPRAYVLDHGYWGQSYGNNEIKKFLETNNIPYRFIEQEEKLIDFVSDQLIAQKVIGWFAGRFEWGPRALGNRSIIADPRNDEMKNIINVKIKFREPYRPFAPSVLAEDAEEYFDLKDAMAHYPARFMLYVVPVKKNKKAVVPAITHIDGSARPQLVYKETNPRYYKLIESFKKKTGVSLILNTSFNLKGEPIVNTPQNAYNTFMKSGMDALILENFVIEKTGELSN